MKTIIVVLLWCILFVLCWPLAVFLFIILGLVWLILLPFRIVGFTLQVLLQVVSAILLLPFRIAKAI